MSPQIIHQPDANRFIAMVDGHEAELAYRRSAGALDLVHTSVPVAIAGQGVAGALVKAALDLARAQGLHVLPSCSYAARYIERHPEYADLIQ